MPPPTDAEVRKRIITHMNSDHPDSVARYIEYYCSASRFAARNAQLKDITLKIMTIISGGKEYIVHFEPPLKSYSEARERVIDMDRNAVTALGRSSVSIKQYQAPRGFHLVVFMAALGAFILLSRDSFTNSKSLLAAIVPAFASFVNRIRLLVLIPMAAIHAAEATYMSTVLAKHSVPLFSDLWFKWVGSCFIEGIGSFQRIKAQVRRQEEKQKSAKH